MSSSVSMYLFLNASRIIDKDALVCNQKMIFLGISKEKIIYDNAFQILQLCFTVVATVFVDLVG